MLDAHAAYCRRVEDHRVQILRMLEKRMHPAVRARFDAEDVLSLVTASLSAILVEKEVEAEEREIEKELLRELRVMREELHSLRQEVSDLRKGR